LFICGSIAALPKILTVFGTRPEAIKMAPLVLALQSEPALEHRLLVTAQHRGLLDDVLQVFGLTPDHDLDLMRERQSLEYITTAALNGVAAVLGSERPDFVLVHGDTTTTFAAALAAFYAQVPVGHVEAGLRTSTVLRPFPEELNRRLADVIAAHYYCPTEQAARSIRGNPDLGGEVFVTGNTALDAVRLCAKPGYRYADQRLAEWSQHSGPRLLVTAHRRENWGEPMADICRGLRGVLEDFPEARICFCWHPNPAVRETISTVLEGAGPSPRPDLSGQAGWGQGPTPSGRVLLVDPPRFDTFINLMADADLILSDSGGIQEEVTQLRKYVLVLRDETERPEAVEAGFALVVGTQVEAVRTAVRDLLPRCTSIARGGTGELPPEVRSPFGDGYASGKIVAAIKARFGLG
jgi:UDP-N-acetylglucosamine 2-epimerase (non-hydrolysing)